MTKLHQPKFVLFLLGTSYLVASLSAFLAEQGSNTAMACVGVMICIPYLVPFAWVGGAEARSKYFDPVWVKVLLILAGVAYAAISSSWASAVLNQAFAVPASNFPIAQAVMSLAYLPINLLGPLAALALALIFISASLIFIWALMASAGWKQALKRISWLIAAVLYLGFFYGSTMSLSKNKIYLAQLIAVKSDFNSWHRCENLRNPLILKIAHVGEGNVLVHYKNKPEAKNFSELFELKKCSPTTTT